MDRYQIFYNPLLLKGAHKDFLNICELFWDVKNGKWIFGKTKTYNKHETGTHFTPQL